MNISRTKWKKNAYAFHLKSQDPYPNTWMNLDWTAASLTLVELTQIRGVSYFLIQAGIGKQNG